MKFSSRQYAQALHQALSGTDPKDHDRLLENFAKILHENRDLGLVDEIEAEFGNYEREAQGVKLAEVATARKLSGEEQKKIVHDLNEYVKGEVELKEKIDEGLVGGIMVRIGDDLIDGSVKKNMEDLKIKLSE